MSKGGLASRLFRGLRRIYTWPDRRRRKYFDSLTSAGCAALEQGDEDRASQKFLWALNAVNRGTSGYEGGYDLDLGIQPRMSEGFTRLAELHGEDGAYGLMARTIGEARSAEAELGRYDPEVANRFERLADLYAVFGYTMIGRKLHGLTLGIRWKTLGPEHLSVADSYDAVAELVPQCDKPTFGYDPDFRRKALEIREKALGSEHPDVLEKQPGFRLEGKTWERDETPFVKALQIRRSELGPKHPRVAELMELVASHCSGAETERLFSEALAIREEIQGPYHPDVARTLLHLYGCYYYMRDADEKAEKALSRAILILLSAIAPEREEWHQEQEIFEFVVLDRKVSRDYTFERFSVTTKGSYLWRLRTGSGNYHHEARLTRAPTNLDEVLAHANKVSSKYATVLSRLGCAIDDGYDDVWDEKGWPRELYGFDSLPTDSLREGKVPCGWSDQFRRFREVVREGRDRQKAEVGED